MPVLPRTRTNSIVAWNVSPDVESPRTTSTRGTFGTGWRKCRPITRSGRFVRVAISVTESEEVLVARMSSGGHSWSSLWKIEALRSRSSYTASITNCAASRPAMSSTVVTRLRMAFFSDSVRRHFAMSRSSDSAMPSTLAFAWSGVFSYSRTASGRSRRRDRGA